MIHLTGVNLVGLNATENVKKGFTSRGDDHVKLMFLTQMITPPPPPSPSSNDLIRGFNDRDE